MCIHESFYTFAGRYNQQRDTTNREIQPAGRCNQRCYIKPADTPMNITTYTLAPHLPRLILGEHEGKVCLCDWDLPQRKALFLRQISRYLTLTEHDIQAATTPLLEQVKAYLAAYHGGNQAPCDVPLLLLGTPFQQTVWQGLRSIPYGTTLTYRQFAQRLQQEQALRAVAHAIGQNPLSIILPCHRIIGTNGTLTGYAGGIPTKAYLLQKEQGSVCHGLLF